MLYDIYRSIKRNETSFKLSFETNFENQNLKPENLNQNLKAMFWNQNLKPENWKQILKPENWNHILKLEFDTIKLKPVLL